MRTKGKHAVGDAVRKRVNKAIIGHLQGKDFNFVRMDGYSSPIYDAIMYHGIKKGEEIAFESRGANEKTSPTPYWKITDTSTFNECTDEFNYICFAIISYGDKEGKRTRGFVLPLPVLNDLIRTRREDPLHLTLKWLWKPEYREYHFKDIDELLKKIDFITK